ncbi:MAG: hypothetical protein BWZ10_01315 [candidate division BRC1 bacterium ADurb.BinA364]|nr:MAG: hypothetical protein BWZ10_01315 [candidate division BRC1 bacterium ADurb.BinA364]
MAPDAKTIERKAARLRRRLRNIEALRRVLRCLVVAAVASCGVILADRLLALEVDEWAVAGALAAAAAVCGAVWALARQPGLHEAAALADRKLNLRERISSALYLLESERPMDRAVVEDAASRAALVRVGDVFPYPFYRELKWLIAAVAAGACMALIPPMDLFASLDKPAVALQPIPPREAEKAAERLKEIKEKLNERAQLKDPLRLALIEKDLEQLQKDFEARKLDRAQAVAKLSKMNEQLAERKKTLEEMLRSTEGVKTNPSDRFTNELAKDLEMADFDAAKQALADLKKKIENGDFAEKDAAKLSEEMQKLAEQLQQSNPALAEAMKKAAEAMQAGQLNMALDALEMAQADLEELAEMMGQMQMLDDLQSECQAAQSEMAGSGGSGRQGEGPDLDGMSDKPSSDWKPGDSNRRGPGMGGPGIDRGGVARVGQDQVKFKNEQIKGQTQPGEILASFKVAGQQTRGEATVEYTEAYIEYAREAEDTLEREPMPLEFRGLVAEYFDSIQPSLQKAESSRDPAEAGLQLAPASPAN